VLSNKKAFTKYALVKATGLRTPVVGKQLKILTSLGWVRKHSFTPPTYQINLKNHLASTFSDFVWQTKIEKGARFGLVRKTLKK
jgi:hypothetical protein